MKEITCNQIAEDADRGKSCFIRQKCTSLACDVEVFFFYFLVCSRENNETAAMIAINGRLFASAKSPLPPFPCCPHVRSDGGVERRRRDKAEIARLGLMNARSGQWEGGRHAQVSGKAQQAAALHIVDGCCPRTSETRGDSGQ